MKKLLACLLVLAMVLALAACGSGETNQPAEDTQSQDASSDAATEDSGDSGAEAEDTADAGESGDPVKVAWLCNSAIADGGWNQEGFDAVTALSEEYGFELSTMENVSDTEVTDLYRNYCNEGYDIIIDNEQYHCEMMAEIAPEYPDVDFVCCNGYVSAPNMISISSGVWEYMYMAGVAAGSATESNKIGLITYSATSDSATTMLASYTAGAKSVNDQVEVVHVATGSFSDLQKGNEMAQSLIDQGCDVLICNSGDCNTTVTELCIEQGVYVISAIVDRNDMSADYVLGSALSRCSEFITRAVDAIYSGDDSYFGEVYVGGIHDGLEAFIVNEGLRGKIDDSYFENLEAAEQALINGEVENPVA